MTSLIPTLSQALRGLRRRPAISLIVIFTMAVGIGANTAILSLVYATLLRPFPYPDADRIVRIQTAGTNAAANSGELSLPDLEDYRTGNRTFESMGAYQTRTMDLTGIGAAYAAQVTTATSGMLRTMAVSPFMGRIFDESSDKPGGDLNKAVLSFGLWKNHFGGDPQIIGKPVRTPMVTYTIIGVMPAGFGYPGRTEMWVPMQSYLAMSNADWIAGRAIRSYPTVGRLRPGTGLTQAESDLRSISARLEHDYASTNAEHRPVLKTLRDAEAGDLRPYLLLLLGATLVMLLICCANVANLLLVSAADRERESSIRAAIGATSARLIRDFLIESIVLAMFGGLLGIAIAAVGVRLLPRLIPSDLPAWLSVEVSSPVLLLTLFIAAGTGILFGLAPALLVSRANLHSALKEGARGSTRGGSLRQILIVCEVALSLTLLISAALLVRSFNRLRTIRPGFEMEHALSFRISPYRPGKGDANIQEYAQLYSRLISRLQQVPGVLAVGATNNLPFTQKDAKRNQIQIGIRGDSAQQKSDRATASLLDVTPGYFAAMGIPLLEGRQFTPADTKDRQMVVIISKRSAERLYGSRPALGQQIRLEYLGGTADPWGVVVGVAGNVKQNAAEDEQGLELYYPNTQYVLATSRVVVRFQGDPAAMTNLIRRAVSEVFPDTAVSEIKPLEKLVLDTLWQQRLWSSLLAGFAATSLLLAGVGLYGLMSYSARQRTREIGIRMALGAPTSRILLAFTAGGVRLAAVGIAVGTVASLAAGRAMQSLLFRISGFDAATYLAIPAILLCVALIATAIPAWRAAAVDPLVALREE